MKQISKFFVLGAFLTFGALANTAEAGGGDSILRVNITSQSWNLNLPWQKSRPDTRRGLGALLEGNRVLVTAELAQDATYIELEQADTGRKLTSKVEFIDYECNLATIVPMEPAGDFFAKYKPLQIDTSVKPPQKLQVWQFESNGSPVSTDVDLTRVDLGTYFLAEERFLIFEANGAVVYRGGTFTLPVMAGDKMCGMLLSYNSKDQVAQILPGVIIQRFLDDVADGKYEGFPHFGVELAPTLDPQFRSYLKLAQPEGGIYVSEVSPHGSAGKAGLKPGDVVLCINGHELDSRGNYKHPDYGLLSVGHVIKGMSKAGDELKLQIWRDGAAQDLTVKMERLQPQDKLVPPYQFDRGNKYVILGGMLFLELNGGYLGQEDRNGRSRAPFRIKYAAKHPEKYEKEGRKKLVILSGILPAESNQGYERMGGLLVDKVNGKLITDIAALDEALKSPKDGVHSIEFADYPKKIFVDAAQAEKDNNETMPQRYRITELKRLD
jgi:hypothetical protein